MKKKILIFIHHFLPGEKAGGPVSSIRNLCGAFKELYDFYIVCLNRDIDGALYSVETNKWIKTDAYSVMYLSDSEYTKKKIIKISEGFNVIYSCGLYEKSSIWLSRYFGNKNKRICIAPMGSLYPSALKRKTLKKQLFIFWTKATGLFKNVFWSASSETELNQIKKIYGSKSNVIVATDPVMFKQPINNKRPSEKGSARLVFVSRINRVKNLDFALNLLREIPDGINIEFDIYGFAEDNAYLQECIKAISRLPATVKCKYLGGLENNDVNLVLSKYDSLLLPTKGENFGHIIYESINAGVFPIISNTTIWNFLENKGCAKCISLDNTDLFKDSIVSYANLSREEKAKIADKCVNEAKLYFENMVKNSGFLRLFENE